MEIESVDCECCGLREDCTREYISSVRADFDGKWLCGLCSAVVRDESRKEMMRKSCCGGGGNGVEEAIRAHISFCSESKMNNPAVSVAQGMRQILRRRSADFCKQHPADEDRVCKEILWEDGCSRPIRRLTGR